MTLRISRHHAAAKVLFFNSSVLRVHTCFLLWQGILWVQVRAVLSIYSPLVLLSAASHPVQTHTYGKRKHRILMVHDSRAVNIYKWVSSHHRDKWLAPEYITCDFFYLNLKIV